MADADSLKPAAHDLVDRLPENAWWEDLMYQIYVSEAIDAGLRDAETGRVVNQEEAIQRLRRPTS
jgi:predicted transcriptional regulator